MLSIRKRPILTSSFGLAWMAGALACGGDATGPGPAAQGQGPTVRILGPSRPYATGLDTLPLLEGVVHSDHGIAAVTAGGKRAILRDSLWEIRDIPLGGASSIIVTATDSGSAPASGSDTLALVRRAPVAALGGMRVLYPNGGEVFRPGDSVDVRFDVLESTPEAMAVCVVASVYRVTKNVAQVNQVGCITPDADGKGRIPWQVPALSPGDSLQIRLSDYSSPGYEKGDKSDGYITIQP